MQPFVFVPARLSHTVGRLLATLLLGLGLSTAYFAHAQTAPAVKFQTSLGDFTVEVYPDKAPKTVENFLQYVKDKQYDGTIFHRVIANFMIQGGGFDSKFVEKKTRPPVRHEGREALSKGGPRNVVGTIAMARTNDPHSATAQFFINVQDNAFLDPVLTASEGSAQGYGYTAFGKVTSGMDVVTKIRSVPTGSGGPFPTDVPKTPVVIYSVTLQK